MKHFTYKTLIAASAAALLVACSGTDAENTADEIEANVESVATEAQQVAEETANELDEQGEALVDSAQEQADRLEGCLLYTSDAADE